MAGVTLEGIVHFTLWARHFRACTREELLCLRRRYSQLADTFFEFDPVSGVPVFSALDDLDQALRALAKHPSRGAVTALASRPDAEP